jgi:hypothetical protein
MALFGCMSLEGQMSILAGMHPKESEIYPKGTTCTWTRPSHKVIPKVVRCKIIDYGFQSPAGGGFLNYIVEIEGQTGTYAAYHGDLKPV